MQWSTMSAQSSDQHSAPHPPLKNLGSATYQDPNAIRYALGRDHRKVSTSHETSIRSAVFAQRSHVTDIRTEHTMLLDHEICGIMHVLQPIWPSTLVCLRWPHAHGNESRTLIRWIPNSGYSLSKQSPDTSCSPRTEQNICVPFSHEWHTKQNWKTRSLEQVFKFLRCIECIWSNERCVACSRSAVSRVQSVGCC